MMAWFLGWGGLALSILVGCGGFGLFMIVGFFSCIGNSASPGTLFAGQIAFAGWSAVIGLIMTILWCLGNIFQWIGTLAH